MKADRTIIEQQDLAIKLAHPDQADELYELLQQERSNLKEYVPWVSETQSLPDTRRFLQESDLFNRGGQKLISMVYFQEKNGRIDRIAEGQPPPPVSRGGVLAK